MPRLDSCIVKRPERRGEVEIMENTENLLKTSLTELERLLSTKAVIGEPLQVAGNTIIPLVSVGFGFGGGGGEGENQKIATGKGAGAGTGAGGGVRPVAVIIIDKDGVARVESVRATATVVEKLGEAVARVMQSSKVH